MINRTILLENKLKGIETFITILKIQITLLINITILFENGKPLLPFSKYNFTLMINRTILLENGKHFAPF